MFNLILLGNSSPLLFFLSSIDTNICMGMRIWASSGSHTSQMLLPFNPAFLSEDVAVTMSHVLWVSLPEKASIVRKRMGFQLQHCSSKVSSSLGMRLRFVGREGFTHPKLVIGVPNLNPRSVGTTEA